MKTVIKGGDAVKTFARRDSATAALKKLGIQVSDYNLFISQTTDGRVAVALDKAEEFLAARLRKVATEVVPQKRNKGRTEKEAESNQIKKPSVAGVVRMHILAGLDNKAIHEILKKDFGHDEDKAHYPAWYRSQMRREGLIAKPDKKTAKERVKVDRALGIGKKLPKAPKKVVSRKAKRDKIAERKRVKASVKKAPTSAAQTNINQTKSASIKTGGAAPAPGRLSVAIAS